MGAPSFLHGSATGVSWLVHDPPQLGRDGGRAGADPRGIYPPDECRGSSADSRARGTLSRVYEPHQKIGAAALLIAPQAKLVADQRNLISYVVAADFRVMNANFLVRR